MWTSQTFSDSYQARSAAICSSLFTCGTGRRPPSAREEAWNRGRAHAQGSGEEGRRAEERQCFISGGVRSFESHCQASVGGEEENLVWISSLWWIQAGECVKKDANKVKELLEVKTWKRKS